MPLLPGLRSLPMKRKRPGCACPYRYADGTRTDASERCDATWIRCNEALKVHHEKRVEDAKRLIEASGAKP